MALWHMGQGIFMRDQETAWSPFAANSENSWWDDSGDRSDRLIRRHRVRELAAAPQ